MFDLSLSRLLSVFLFEIFFFSGLFFFTFPHKTGDGDYNSNDYSFPENGNIWYGNSFLQIVAGNVIFALFINGLVKVCAKLQNPFTDEDMSFPEYAYGQ